ncbi:uncharacterized protein F5147DRAFT_76854 [Suillus discolor]|uniref:DUF6533 domain-containing protein n=1 Tax=Suillus discolor TaxID=1912936 RepID=A0A9P7ERB9_9AGAM|nr:uncharacterized protein F5147DRAFT_76854 [Suillus discolor]KAG2086536.1 hypothetical protein F5147DRAFT_76854 [Suillus discolor]
MTTVSNNSSWWPIINSNIFYSYWIVAAGVVMIYDWVLTLGREIELIWIRYFGIIYFVANILTFAPFVSLTDIVSNITYCIQNGMGVVLYAMLGIIMITRLHVMYQGSRKMLILLVIIFLTVTITCGVVITIALEHIVGEELILSGTYMCEYESEGDDVQLLFLTYWILYTVWEVLALCLSVWIAVKYFRDLRRLGPSTGSTAGDCFRVLIKAHMLYFASFVGVSLFQLTSISQSLVKSVLNGAVQISSVVQVFVLGPRLILSIREHHAKLVASFDTENSINSIAFQEISTSSTM